MTEPLTPADLDLRDFPYMPLDVVRLRDSESAVLSSGDAFRAAVLLWCAAWHQVPAASLPNDDRLLANLAGYGRDMKGWKAVRDGALRCFVECSDGRLYHPVIAEKAIEAATKRRDQKHRTKAATKARQERNEQRDVGRDDLRDVNRDDGRNVVQGKGREGNSAEPNGSGVPPPDPKAELFDRGRQVLGKQAGGLIAKVLKSQGKEDDPKAIAKARALIEQASTKADGAEWLGRVLAPKNGGDFKLMSGMEGVV